MSVEQRMVDLIEADWSVLDPDFDPIAFQLWRRRAFASLTALFGPDHVYTRHFENFVRQGRKTDLLAARRYVLVGRENWTARHGACLVRPKVN